MNLGRQPAIRQEIEAALEAYIRGDATPEQTAMFKDWGVMSMATLAQAVKFELVHEARTEDDRAIVDGWFRVMRVRAQQNSVEKKLARKLRSAPVATDGSVAADV